MTLHIAAFGDSHTNIHITSELPGPFAVAQIAAFNPTRKQSRPWEWTSVLEEMFNGRGIDASVVNYGAQGVLAEDVGEIALNICSFSPEQRMLFFGLETRPDIVILQGGANNIGYIVSELSKENGRAVLSNIKSGMLGINRFRFETFDGLLDYLVRSESVQHTASVLEEACSQLKKRRFQVVYWNIPPLRGTINLPPNGKFSSLNSHEIQGLTAQRLRAPLNSRLREYCAENGIAYADVASAVSGSDGWLKPEYNSGDYLHLNAAGNQKVAEVIFKALRPLPQISQ